MEESELLRLLHRGDPAGLEALIVRYTPYVSAVAARSCPAVPGSGRRWRRTSFGPRGRSGKSSGRAG